VHSSTDVSNNGPQLRIPTYVIVIAAGTLFVLHALVVWDWVVDDAGISFAYSRSLSQGHGLVSQPGVERIEGYSNFLWVLLLAPWFKLGLFDAVITPKIISIILSIGSLAVMARILSYEHARDSIWALGALVLTSLNTSFVVWSTSGLENPLYVLLLCLLLFCSERAVSEDATTVGRAALIGFIVAGIAMTRPEGILYFPVYPAIVLTAKRFQSKTWPDRRGMIHLGIYGLCVVCLYLMFLAFRLYYFNDIFPNTYYAKTSPTLRILFVTLTMQAHAALKFDRLMSYVVGKFGFLTCFLLALTNFYIIYSHKFSVRHIAHGLFLISLVFVFLIMPTDWMGADRFATPFIIFFYTYSAMTLGVFLGLLPIRGGYRTALVVAVVVLAIIFSAVFFCKRSIGFASVPVFPMAEVARHFALRYNVYAKELGIKEGSILIPDVGGMLYYSKLRVYDLGGLCDRTIAHNLGLQFGKTTNYENLLNYIFERTKPTFIVLHGAWFSMARLESDNRFFLDYVAIRKCCGPEQQGSRPRLIMAEYVRKESVQGKSEVLNKLRKDFGGIGVERCGPWTLNENCAATESDICGARIP
jgi:hypothetical protein